jgi:uncharacterized protein (DUF983 family)
MSKEDELRAIQIRNSAKIGKLESCPKCKKIALFWNHLNEGRWECLACGKYYDTEYSLIAAECNARNEEKYKDSQRNSS